MDNVSFSGGSIDAYLFFGHTWVIGFFPKFLFERSNTTSYLLSPKIWKKKLDINNDNR